MKSEDKIDRIIEFWRKLEDDDILTQAIAIYIDRITSECEDSVPVSERVIKQYSFSQIKFYCYFNFLTYIFVSIFRGSIELHVIEDIFFVVWNDEKKREDLKDRIATEFILKVTDLCKKIK
jgi:hypothetical protein